MWLNDLKAAWRQWNADSAGRLGAALAFYTAFSLAPLILIAMAVGGMVFGKEAVQGQIVGQIKSFVGSDAAIAIQDVLASARSPGQSLAAQIFGAFALLLGASGVFGELQAAMGVVWKTKKKPRSRLLAVLRSRFLSITLVLGSCFLMVVSLVASAAVAAGANYVTAREPLVMGIDFLASVLVFTLAFSMLYKYLPDVYVAYKDVWQSALLTAVLFVVGKHLLALYIATTGVASAYGAAGSLIVILLWAYYSAQLFLFGAELSHVMAMRRINVQPGP